MSGKPEKDPVADALAWLDATAPEGLPFAIARNSGVAGVTAGDVSVVLGGAGAAASGEVSLLPKLPDVPAFITEVEEATHWKLYSLFTTANSDEEGAALVREAVSIRACPNITALVDDRIMPLYDIEVSTLAPHFASLKEHLNTQFTDTMLRYESKITDLDKLRDKSISKIQEERQNMTSWSQKELT